MTEEQKNDELLLINDDKSNNIEFKSNNEIEEMANTINEMDEPNAHYYGEHLEMYEAFADCFTIAKHLYNAGYRKQVEGEWKQTTEPLGAHDVDCVMCSVCGDSWILDEEFDFDTAVDLWHYCPTCGAKMVEN